MRDMSEIRERSVLYIVLMLAFDSLMVDYKFHVPVALFVDVVAHELVEESIFQQRRARGLGCAGAF